jgi:PAS domain S-box-containing protein
MVQFDIQEQILEKLNALVVVLNANGNAEYVSKSACQLLGFDNDQLMGSNWWEVTRFSKPEGERTKNRILAVMRKKPNSVESFEHLFRTSYGGQKWIRWNVSYLNENQIIGIGYDITETRQQEKQLRDRNAQLQQQHKEIKDSIFYAQRIQQNSLQSKEYIRSVFNSNFVLYKPKDIVSGDFYFFFQDDDNRYAIVVDCTGHGVPGAMMSMVANSIIKEVLLNKKVKSVSGILYELDRELFKAINSYGSELSSDGMDVAVISISKKTNRLHFAGAFRPMIIVRREQVMEFRASRFPLGFYNDVEKVFDEQVILLQPGDNLFLFTDGFIDQFGGGENKKLNKRNFKELVKMIADMPVDEQESFLDYSFNNWKQEEEQTDDVLVVGIKI